MEERIRKEVKNFLDENGKLKALPVKRKPLIYALYYLSTRFEPKRIYSEHEINDIINDATAFYDPALVRRELYNKRFIDRKSNGSEYWLEEQLPTFEGIDLSEGK